MITGPVAQEYANKYVLVHTKAVVRPMYVGKIKKEDNTVNIELNPGYHINSDEEITRPIREDVIKKCNKLKTNAIISLTDIIAISELGTE